MREPQQPAWLISQLVPACVSAEPLGSDTQTTSKSKNTPQNMSRGGGGFFCKTQKYVLPGTITTSLTLKFRPGKNILTCWIFIRPESQRGKSGFSVPV